MRDPSITHGTVITHFCVAQRQGVKRCCISNAVNGTDDDMLWNVRSECEEGEGTDCEDGDSDTDW